jgi:hypothetical protein
MGAPKLEVQKNIDTAQLLLVEMRLRIGAECVQADLSLREGQTSYANMLFCKNLKAAWAKDSEVVTHCLEILAEVTRWNGFHGISNWPTVFLAHSLKSKEKLGILMAVQFLGDLFLAEDDEDTAVALFTVALEGFTYMDIHRSRAECMLRLGDIAKGHGDLLKALELWETARPLFERSSQGKQIETIDGRLASMAGAVHMQHRADLALLAGFGAPSGSLEEDNEPSNIEKDIDGLNVDDVKLNWVAI